MSVTPLVDNEIELTTTNSSLLQPHNIKCKIINNKSNFNCKSKIIVTDELDDFGLLELANDNKNKTNISTDLASNTKKSYSLRSAQKKLIDDVTSNLIKKNGVVDEVFFY